MGAGQPLYVRGEAVAAERVLEFRRDGCFGERRMKRRLTFAAAWLMALLATIGPGSGQQSTVKPLTRGGFIAGTTTQFAHEIGNLQPLLAAMGQSYPVTLAYSFANNATSAFVGSTGQYG